MRLPVISLFSGAGGLDLGLESAGFDIRVCIEQDSDRCYSLKLNRPAWKITQCDIRKMPTPKILEIAGLQVGEAALVSGGPPCQPFSKSAFWVPGRLEELLKDPRASMLGEFARVVAEAKPKAFVMENVFGLAYSTGRPALDGLLARLTKESYTISWKVINAADYGVPQKRERLFVIGARDGDAFQFPSPTHGNSDSGLTIGPHVTAGQAIGDLDDGTVGEGEKVEGRWGALLPLVPPGQNYLYFTKKRGYPKPKFAWRSRFWSFLLKLSPDRPSWTIQASPGPYIGPFHWRNRRLRINEIKRLQTFPDNYKLYGQPRSQWSQIGDAVPPLLGRRLGEAIVTQFFRDPTQPCGSRRHS